MATTHTVVNGDTLWGIAEKYLGSGTKYKQLATINNISNPDLIYIGQVIKLSADGSSSGTSTSSTKVGNLQMGQLASDDSMLVATWTWGREKDTASYHVVWTYDTGDGVWFKGNDEKITVDEDKANYSLSKYSTYTIPDNARSVRFKVKPISKTEKKNDKEESIFEGSWSETKTWTNSTPLTTPSAPNVEIEKYKLTATLDNVDIDATGIEFQIVKNNSSTVYKTGKATIATGHVSYSCSVDAGGEYKVRCRAYKGSLLSDWSPYSGNQTTIPATPSGITVIRATSETSVYLEWASSYSAESYDIEYTDKKEQFDITDQPTKKTGIELTKQEITGLESGHEYFFRVRANNGEGSSGWSEIKSIVVGTTPAAPTTWSSTTTAITGETLVLYWVHNSEDASTQTYAELEFYVDGVMETHTIDNSERPEGERDKTSSFKINTSTFVEGTKIQWRVRTAGITKEYGDWSIQRTVDIYAPPTLELSMTDSDANPISTLTAFPFYIRALAGPKTQVPTGYHLTITANAAYETTDSIGNPKTINAGDQVYSKYFDTREALLVELSAGSVDLENGINYTVTCVVSMNSGLTDESSLDFNVAWVDAEYQPNAAVSIDENSMTAYIRPYCVDGRIAYYQVNLVSGSYVKSSTDVGFVVGDTVPGIVTTTGEQVYSGMTADGNDIYFCMVEETTEITDVTLSVYRREFDGSFVELASGLDGAKNTTITDPHPALDYARYRIVATSKSTGSVSFYDPPGHPVGGKAVIIQWDEAWSSFETSEEAAMEQPPWSGSLLKLPYNIDVTNSNKLDVSLVEYIGRSHPVTYYGTQVGESAAWNIVIDKQDKETLYGLRRLAKWMGDVYVREPSGSGYWATINVSFSQKHCDVTIPVTLDITRVEGGV